MREKSVNPIFRIDVWVLLIYFLLLFFGWVSLCGASHNIGDVDFLSWDSRTGKQLAWIGCAIGLGSVIMMIEDRYYEILADVFYWFMVILLFITPFIAHDVKGSRSWLPLGPVSLQPAEFAKCATALVLAKLINQYGFTLIEMRNFAKAAGLILLPMVLSVLQKETRTALVY